LTITLENVGKKFVRDWIFRRVSLTLQAGGRYAVVGANGSGKSTLLQVLAGALPPSEGTLRYARGTQALEVDEVFRHVVVASPYLELIEEFTPAELVDFHLHFKPFKQGLTREAFLAEVNLLAARDKAIGQFSSGMKQRLKLGLAFFSEAAVVLLDEPTSNLDAANTAWYHHQLKHALGPDQLVLIASNQPSEYALCDEVIDIQRFK
jgi:ABC-type multidrug transport system ATPase subunit